MAKIKLTKNELRAQQKKQGQLERYLPTLQLKKAMLQAEVYEARQEIARCEEAFQKLYKEVEVYSALLTARTPLDPSSVAKVVEVKKRYENIAGVDVPYFEEILFEEVEYSLFDTPPWVDRAILGLRELATAKVQVAIVREKRVALEKELRMVSIRVNLFEKVLIPRCLVNIKKIKVFLGDQELAAVSQAKVAKKKIEANRARLKLGAA